MGNLTSVSEPVTKTTNSVFVLPSDHYLIRRFKSDYRVETARAAASCCQCKMCTDLCPRYNLGHPIEPHKIMLAAACNNFKDVSAFLNTFYCSSCGVCEMFACPQGLSPRKLIQEIKTGLKNAGITPPLGVEAGKVSPIREYRKVPLDRLVSRLAVKKYQANAPLDNQLIDGFKVVNIPTRQHIGAPSNVVVKFGDRVEKGQVIAEASKGLSVNIHASISGVVIEADSSHVVIKAN